MRRQKDDQQYQMRLRITAQLPYRHAGHESIEEGTVAAP
jgi:hypothetical protein